MYDFRHILDFAVRLRERSGIRERFSGGSCNVTGFFTESYVTLTHNECLTPHLYWVETQRRKNSNIRSADTSKGPITPLQQRLPLSRTAG